MRPEHSSPTPIMIGTRRARLGAYLYVALVARRNEARKLTSEDIGVVCNINATQVRRDISEQLGGVGKRGKGFRPEKLIKALSDALGSEGVAGAGALLIDAERANIAADAPSPYSDYPLAIEITLGARHADTIDAMLALRVES